MIRLIIFVALLVFAVQSIFADPEAIKEALTGILFIGLGIVVVVFALGLFRVDRKG
jgi:hypothetical protein